MKRLLVCFVFLFLFMPTAAAADEAEIPSEPDVSITDGVDAWLQELDVDTWQAFLETLPDEVRLLWSDVSLETLIGSWAQSGTVGEVDGIADRLFSLLLQEAKNSVGLLLSLLAIAFLTGFVHAIAGGRENGVQEVTGFVSRCFALTVVLTTVLSAVTTVLTAMDALVRFMQLALPVLLGLLTAVGGVVTAGVFQPAMALLCGAVSGAMRSVVVPLALLGGLIDLLGALSDRIRMGELAGLMRRLAKWIIGAASSFYIGTTAVRGMTAATYDGITLRTAKYAASSLVPMVGGMVSGTMDTMLGCAALVKNAAGLTAMLLALSVVLVPLLRLIARMFLLRFAAALAEPIAGKKLPAMLGSAADMLSFLFAATAAIALMFMVTVGLITGLGSTAVFGG